MNVFVWCLGCLAHKGLSGLDTIVTSCGKYKDRTGFELPFTASKKIRGGGGGGGSTKIVELTSGNTKLGMCISTIPRCSGINQHKGPWGPYTICAQTRGSVT